MQNIINDEPALVKFVQLKIFGMSPVLKIYRPMPKFIIY